MKMKPTGQADSELAGLMQQQGANGWFQRKMRFWRWVRRAKELPDKESFLMRFVQELCKADYREFKGEGEASALGWAGLAPALENPSQLKWTFAIANRFQKHWVFGPFVMQHELFHAAQDLHSQEEQPRFWWAIRAPAILFVLSYIAWWFLRSAPAFLVWGVSLQNLLVSFSATALFCAAAGLVLMCIRWPKGSLFAAEHAGTIYGWHALLIELEAFLFGWLVVGFLAGLVLFFVLWWVLFVIYGIHQMFF